MKLWPSDSYEIQTPIQLEEVVRRLEEQIEPAKWFRISHTHKFFQGEVSREGFKITRIVHYRNSFLPVIRGTFKQGEPGVTVLIRMRLHPFVTAFMYFWFGGVSLGILAVIAGLLSGQTKIQPMMIIPFGMIIIGWALITGGFWFEAKKQKAMLIAMLEASHRSEQPAGADRIKASHF